MAKKFGWITMDGNNAERAATKGALTKKLEAKGLVLDEGRTLLLHKVQACEHHPSEQGRVVELRHKGEYLRLLARAEPGCTCYTMVWEG